MDNVAEGSSATDFVKNVTEVRKKKDASAIIISLNFSRSWGFGYFVF